MPGPTLIPFHRRVGVRVYWAASSPASGPLRPLRRDRTRPAAALGKAPGSKAGSGGASAPTPSAEPAADKVAETAPAPTAAVASAAAAAAAAAAADDQPAAAKSEEYTEAMQQKTGTTLTYRHELGMNWSRILPDLIVGSCPQTPDDIDRLAETEGVTTILNLQENCDMEYFGIDIAGLQERAEKRGDVRLVRFPIRDFDPFDLRQRLPKVVSKIAQVHDPSSGGTLYVHCTAGMGRAPSTALAYLFWLRGMKLKDGYDAILSKRACSPKTEAIRSATADLLLSGDKVATSIGLQPCGAKEVAVAGLDVGWNARLPMAWCAATQRWTLHRTMFPGRYQFKFVMDEAWSASADHLTMLDGDNVNNYINVMARAQSELAGLALSRLMSDDGDLTDDERAELHAMLAPWSPSEASSWGGPGATPWLDD